MIDGYPIYKFKKVNSTMDIAEKFINENKMGIIVAEEQTEGRGRYGRKWYSPKGGLYFSFQIKKNNLTDFLSEIVALSLIDTMKEFGLTCKIKFPNDIIINEKKICGILIERKGDFYIVGIGINIKKIKGEYISMEELTEKNVEIYDVLDRFIWNFEKECEIFEKNFDKGIKNWCKNLLK
jgi:BirA family biotin operon repressor/biotin-[acetyl-CoA-carboxylase] ligase